MRSLVTGGNGYFGRLLVEHLRARGDAVRVLDIDVEGAGGAGVEVVQGDIRDERRVREAVDGVDVVYHNVAQVPLAKDHRLLRSVNVDGTALLLAASAEAGVSKVVHTSSSAVFGVPEANPVLPTTVPKPQEAYGEAKLAAEWACLRAAADGLDVSIVRPRTILGHGRLGIFGILFDWIADGADPIVLGDGTNRYQFVHADDLADVCLLAGARSGPSIFNAGTDRFGTMGGSPRAPVPARGHGRTGPPAARRARRRGDAGQRRAAPDTVRAVPLADVRPVDVVRHRARAGAAGLDASLVDRRDVRPELRLVRGPPGGGVRRRQRHLATPPHRPLRRARRAEAPHRVPAAGPLMTPVEPRAGRSRTTWLAVALLAALAYVPALASSPGKMPADTKLYLYLNPARLISDAPYTFDARQFAGWVPHQVIAYLWPQGPWFWLGDTVRLPDWVVHRLWIGTLMFLAGAGVLWLCRRRFGLGVLASLAAAIVYQLSPYLLPYVSRTSAMLLPWAGLGWLVGLTMGAALRTRWRDAALAALVVVSIGAVNATAIMMIIPGPLLWLVVAALERQVAWRRAVAAALRIGVLAAGVSLWWIAAVSIQGKLGADVLSYSESLKAVSFTSTSTEVWRGLGYWLTYIRDPYAATTTAGADYMTSSKVILAGFLLLILGVAGLVAVRWRQRRYAIALVVTGVVLGVGVHPIDHPSPLMRVLRGDGESGLALALRSSTRAVPVLALGLGLGIAMVVQVLPAWRRSTAGAAGADGREPHTAWVGRVPWRALATAGVLVLALVNLPVLTHHALVDPALERDEQPPAAWTEAAAALDAAPPGYRVMELPGAEFGAFRWGYTVDPPLPGLTDRPLVTRDLLPLGSAGAMDLLYALDDRFQAGVAETGEVAPVAPAARRGHHLVARRRGLRPVPHPPPRDHPRAVRGGRRGDRGAGDARALRAAGAQPAQRPHGRRAVAVRSTRRPARAAGRAGAGAGPRGGHPGEGPLGADRRLRRRRRRQRRGRAARRPRADPLRRVAERPRPGCRAPGRRPGPDHRFQP